MTLANAGDPYNGSSGTSYNNQVEGCGLLRPKCPRRYKSVMCPTGRKACCDKKAYSPKILTLNDDGLKLSGWGVKGTVVAASFRAAHPMFSFAGIHPLTTSACVLQQEEEF